MKKSNKKDVKGTVIIVCGIGAAIATYVATSMVMKNLTAGMIPAEKTLKGVLTGLAIKFGCEAVATTAAGGAFEAVEVAGTAIDTGVQIVKENFTEKDEKPELKVI